MSQQDTGIFSVRRPREVSHFQASQPRRHASIHSSLSLDARRHQLQFCHPTTGVSIETFQFHIRPQRLSHTTNSPSCTICFFIKNVPCTESATATLVPTLIVRNESGGYGASFDCTTQFIFESLWGRNGKR